MNRITPNSFVQVVARKCSDKVQPHIHVGGVYYVKGVEKTKAGATVLLLDRKHHKEPIRCNSDRFSWEEVSREKAMDIYIREQSKRNVGQMRQMYSEQELLQMAILPMVVVEIAWRYADMAVSYTVEHRISEVKKLTRAIRALRDGYIENVRKDLDQAHINDIRRQADEFVANTRYDFAILYHSATNVIYTQFPGIAYPELRVYAYISQQIITVCEDYVHRNTLKVRARMGMDIPEVRIPFVSEFVSDLYVCMGAYLGDYIPRHDITIANAMAIFKKNLNNVIFTATPCKK